MRSRAAHSFVLPGPQGYATRFDDLEALRLRAVPRAIRRCQDQPRQVGGCCVHAQQAPPGDAQSFADAPATQFCWLPQPALPCLHAPLRALAAAPRPAPGTRTLNAGNAGEAAVAALQLRAQHDGPAPRARAWLRRLRTRATRRARVPLPARRCRLNRTTLACSAGPSSSHQSQLPLPATAAMEPCGVETTILDKIEATQEPLLLATMADGAFCLAEMGDGARTLTSCVHHNATTHASCMQNNLAPRSYLGSYGRTQLPYSATHPKPSYVQPYLRTYSIHGEHTVSAPRSRVGHRRAQWDSKKSSLAHSLPSQPKSSASCSRPLRT